MSYSTFKTAELHPIGRLILRVFGIFRLIDVQHEMGEDKQFTQVNNFTLINFVLKVFGPLHEQTLTLMLMAVQVRSGYTVFLLSLAIILSCLSQTSIQDLILQSTNYTSLVTCFYSCQT